MNSNNSKKQLTIVLEYNRSYFDQKIETLSKFYKSLSNSKATLKNGVTNREWWKSLNVDGFYKYKMTKDLVKIGLVLQSEKNIDHFELISRVEKIGKPSSMEVIDGDIENISFLSEDLHNREGATKFGWTKN